MNPFRRMVTVGHNATVFIQNRIPTEREAMVKPRSEGDMQCVNSYPIRRLHCDPDYQSQLDSARTRHVAYVINPSVTSFSGRDFSPDRDVPVGIPSRTSGGEKSPLNHIRLSTAV